MKVSSKGVIIIGGFFALLTITPGLHAQTTAVLTNLPGNSNYGGTALTLTSNQWGAIGLTMSGTTEDFASLTGYFENITSSDLTLDGGIYSNNAGLPGSLLASFTSQTVAHGTNSPTSFTLLTTSVYALQANTTYWFVLGDTPQGIKWMADTSNSNNGTVPTVSSGYTSDGYATSANGGSSWAAESATHYTEQIDVTSSVPEPSTWGLLAAGVCALVGFGRRRK